MFKTRDGLVHHAMRSGPQVIMRVTDKSVLFGAPDTYGITADAAQRAVAITETILMTCLAAPKPATREWVDRFGQFSV